MENSGIKMTREDKIRIKSYHNAYVNKTSDVDDQGFMSFKMSVVCPICGEHMDVTGFIRYKQKAIGRSAHSFCGVRTITQGKCEKCSTKIDRTASWTWEEMEAEGLKVRPE